MNLRVRIPSQAKYPLSFKRDPNGPIFPLCEMSSLFRNFSCKQVQCKSKFMNWLTIFARIANWYKKIVFIISEIALILWTVKKWVFLFCPFFTLVKFSGRSSQRDYQLKNTPIFFYFWGKTKNIVNLVPRNFLPMYFSQLLFFCLTAYLSNYICCQNSDKMLSFGELFILLKVVSKTDEFNHLN